MTTHKQVSIIDNAIQCDEEIADIIEILNLNNVETIISCQKDGGGKVWIQLYQSDLDQFMQFVLKKDYSFFSWLQQEVTFGISYQEDGIIDEEKDEFIGNGKCFSDVYIRFSPSKLKTFKKYLFKLYETK